MVYQNGSTLVLGVNVHFCPMSYDFSVQTGSSWLVRVIGASRATFIRNLEIECNPFPFLFESCIFSALSTQGLTLAVYKEAFCSLILPRIFA